MKQEIEKKARKMDLGNRNKSQEHGTRKQNKKNQKYRTRKQKQKAKIREPEAREKGYKQGPMNKKSRNGIKDSGTAARNKETIKQN